MLVLIFVVYCLYSIRSVTTLYFEVKMKGLLMKNQLTFVYTFLLLSCMYLESSLFHIAVPEMLVDEQATLVLYMLDTQGNQSVGKLQLDSSCRSRSILQAELQITSCCEVDLIGATSMDLLHQDASDLQSVVVCFELDDIVQVMRILVIKDCFLDNDPFDIVSVDFNALDMQCANLSQEQDEFGALVESIQSHSLDHVSYQSRNTTSNFEQYLLYAKIFMLMQYGKAQRVMRGMSSWLQEKN